MPAKTDEDASSSAKSAAAAESAAKTPSADGQGAAAASAAAMPPPSFDAAFKSLITPLYRQLHSIKLELHNAQTAASAAAPAANSAQASESSEPRALGLSEDLVKSLVTKLEGFEKLLGGSSGADNDLRKALEELGGRQSGMGNQVVEQIVQNVRKDLHEVVKGLIDFRQLIDARLARMEEAVKGSAQAPVAVQVRPQQSPPTFPLAEIDDDQWKEIILGVELCQDPSIAEARARLFRGVLNEDDSAKALAGQMLLVQAASPDRLPPLMKDVGEAYYRWRPKTPGVADPFETALAGYLKRRCDAGGLGNTIELVIVGDRFDIARHNAAERGATITAVHGWVVLRDNGKVYTKANVSVK